MCHSYFFHAQSEQPSQFTKCWSRLVIPGGLTAMLPLVQRLVQLSGSWAVASVRTVYEVSVPPCKTWERTTMLLLVQRLAQSLNAGRQRHQLRESPWCKSQCSFKKLGCRVTAASVKAEAPGAKVGAVSKSWAAVALVKDCGSSGSSRQTSYLACWCISPIVPGGQPPARHWWW